MPAGLSGTVLIPGTRGFRHGQSGHHQGQARLHRGYRLLLRRQEELAHHDRQAGQEEIRPGRAQARRIQGIQDQVGCEVSDGILNGAFGPVLHFDDVVSRARCSASGARNATASASRLAAPWTTNIFLRNPKIPIDGIPILLHIFRVLFEEGPLSRSDPAVGQSESWPDRGAPDRSTAWLVERREALRPTSLGARGSPCRARWVRYSRLKGARWCPGASRRSTPPCAGRARDWQTSDALRRENAEAWLFESVDQKLSKTLQHTPRHTRA